VRVRVRVSARARARVRVRVRARACVRACMHVNTVQSLVSINGGSTINVLYIDSRAPIDRTSACGGKSGLSQTLFDWKDTIIYYLIC